MSKFTDAVQFFYFNASSSYMPGRESQIVGQLLGADELARAEQWARSIGATFEWTEDDQLADYQDNDGKWCEAPAVVCVMSMRQDCGHMHTVESRSGIIESEDWREQMNDRRVIEAELALEARGRVS